MSDSKEKDQEEEPSIEEILTSIRHIISDDDEEEGAEKGDTAEPAEEEEVEQEQEDVLDLTDKVDDEQESTVEDSEDVAPVDEDEPVEIDLTDTADEADNEPVDMPEVDASDLDTEILTQGAAAAALAGFTKLAKDIQVTRSYDGVTLEEIVRTQLDPLLREWLDKNLPRIIERLVREELEKISKRVED